MLWSHALGLSPTGSWYRALASCGGVLRSVAPMTDTQARSPTGPSQSPLAVAPEGTAVSAEEPLPSLSAGAFALSLAVVLTLFLVLNPFWEPMDVAEVDQNIGWSYAPIPLLVGFFLLWEKKRRWAALFIETMRLTFVKFAITWLAANLYWAVAGLPEPVARQEGLEGVELAEMASVFAERTAPAATALDLQRTGELRGIVADDQGLPVAGALVYVSRGLEGYSFSPPVEPVLIDHEGDGFTPALAVVHAFQPVVLRGGDSLHSAQAVSASGRVLFTYALVPGVDKRLMFGRNLGLVRLACTVHEDEAGTVLAVLEHPFVTTTDDQGRFALSDVPATDLDVSSWSAAHGSGRATVLCVAGEVSSVAIAMTPEGR